MNFENNGQPESDASRRPADLPDDDVMLTALALGQISDPLEIRRLEQLLDQDEAKRTEFESTARLAGMIRDAVDNDLPLAPGSIHDVVVAALASPTGPASHDDSAAQSGMTPDRSLKDSPASAADRAEIATSSTSDPVTPKSTRGGWNINLRLVTQFSAVVALVIVCAVILLRQNWVQLPTNLALAERDEATENQASGSIESTEGVPSNRSRMRSESAIAEFADESRLATDSLADTASPGEERSALKIQSDPFIPQPKIAASELASGAAETRKPEPSAGGRPSAPSSDSFQRAQAPPQGAGQSPQAMSAPGGTAAADRPPSSKPASLGFSQDGLREQRLAERGLDERGFGRGGAGGAGMGGPGIAGEGSSRGGFGGGASGDRQNPSGGQQPAADSAEARKQPAAGGGGPGNSPARQGQADQEQANKGQAPEKRSVMKLELAPAEESEARNGRSASSAEAPSQMRRSAKAADAEAPSDDAPKTPAPSQRQSESLFPPAAAGDAAADLPAEPESKDMKASEEKLNLGVENQPQLDDSTDTLRREPIRQIDPALENDFVQPIGTDAISTFSIDTDTASYTNVRQMLRSGRLPDPEQVRIEEMVNYFDFKYPQPQDTERFSVDMELASSPWSPGHKILKIGLQARSIRNEDRPPSNLVFLIDVSGSMRASNKLPLLKDGLKKMVGKLREDDYVSIVTYANQTEIRLEPTDGSQKEKIIAAIDGLEARGGTDGGQGLQTAYRLAEQHLLKNGTNRIVLGTDGDFNVGIQDDQELAEMVREKAQAGVFLTVCGFGTDNFQDRKMQLMSQNGNGKVYYIDSEQEADRVFAERISGSLVTIAKDVKLQLLFNPRTVRSYRLIGYENRMLNREDFADDRKDAGEMDAGDSVTALYEIVPAEGEPTFPTATDGGEPLDLKYQVVQRQTIELTELARSTDIAALRIRYKAPDADQSELREFVVQDNELAFNRASQEFQLATAVAGLGMMLRGSQHRGGLNYDNLREFGQTVLAERPDRSDETSDSEAAAVRRRQREEVLELINRAAEIAFRP